MIRGAKIERKTEFEIWLKNAEGPLKRSISCGSRSITSAHKPQCRPRWLPHAAWWRAVGLRLPPAGAWRSAAGAVVAAGVRPASVGQSTPACSCKEQRRRRHCTARSVSRQSSQPCGSACMRAEIVIAGSTVHADHTAATGIAASATVRARCTVRQQCRAGCAACRQEQLRWRSQGHRLCIPMVRAFITEHLVLSGDSQHSLPAPRPHPSNNTAPPSATCSHPHTPAGTPSTSLSTCSTSRRSTCSPRPGSSPPSSSVRSSRCGGGGVVMPVPGQLHTLLRLMVPFPTPHPHPTAPPATTRCSGVRRLYVSAVGAALAAAAPGQLGRHPSAGACE